VMECEEEIKLTKNALRSRTSGTNSAESSLNRLQVSVHSMVAAEGRDCGDPDVAPTTFKIHLSSPIEESTITQLYDPLDTTADGSLAKFESIEIANALLTVELYSNDDGTSPSKLLGHSAPHDLLPLCQDMELWKQGGEKKTKRVEIVLVAAKGIDESVVPTEESLVKETDETETHSEGAFEDAVSEEMEEGSERQELTKEEGAPEKDEDVQEESSTKAGDVEESIKQPADVQEEKKTPELQLPIYTLSVQLEYTPSPEDKRDALYDTLNEVSKRKVAAIESLRKNAAIVNRAKAAEGGNNSSKNGSGAGANKSPAVKSGFLNKSSSKNSSSEGKHPPFWKRWYAKTLGPQSMLWVVGPIAKNYVLFAGVSLFIHYKGDLLALPPPV